MGRMYLSELSKFWGSTSVFKDNRAIGAISLWAISQVLGSRWNSVKVGEVARANLAQADQEADLKEVLRLINQQQRHRLVLIINSDGTPTALITLPILFSPSRSTTKLKSRPARGSNPMQQRNGTAPRTPRSPTAFIAPER
jgi:hypothetical protein